MAYSATGFNLATNQKAERKLLVTCVNTGTSGTDKWTVIGAGVEDSSIELSPDTETITDILGVTETTINKLEMKQTLEPMTIRGGNELLFKLNDILERNALSELANFDVLVIRAYLTEGTGGSTKYHAEKHTGCTITPQSLGGSAYVDMPIEISFSNNKVLGTVDHYKAGETITFTVNSESPASE